MTCCNHNCNQGRDCHLRKKNLPSHVVRNPGRTWTIKERIRIAQGHSLTTRKKAISLSAPPWEG